MRLFTVSYSSIITLLKKYRFFPIFLVIFYSLVIICFDSNAEKTIVLENNKQFIETVPSSVLEDKSNQLTISQLLLPYWQQQFHRNELDLNYNRDKLSTYWKKITVYNHSSSSSWLLEFPDPHIEFLKIYLVKKGEIESFPSTGYGQNFSSRTIAHKNFVFELNIGPDEKMEVYAQIYAHNRFCGINTNIRSLKNFSWYFLTEYHILGLYYGIILILVIYNLFLGFFIHEKVHFYYCLYTVCCALFTYSEDGLAIQWLWPNHPYLNTLLIKSSPILLILSFLLYSDQFIELKSNFPKVRKYIWGALLLYLATFLLLPGYPRIAYLPYILPFLITCLAAIKIYRDGFRPARFFVAGNSMILLSFIVYYIRINGWIDSNAFTVYMFNYAFVFEATILSMSLADKVKTTKIQSELAQKETIRQLRINEELQQKVNKELEGKVQERTKELLGKTKELMVANDHLETLKKQLYEMNSKMDINIWELKKEVKKETEARILNNLLSYEEFLSFYPDTKCYLYLKDLKWKEGYICLKCNNTKFGRGNNPYTFKCTQCQHQQSVTSNTLFHGLKFPISKAFYLVYYLSRNERKISYEELAEKLELNKNTVWSFDKKLKESVQLATSNQIFAPDWQSLLLARN